MIENIRIDVAFKETVDDMKDVSIKGGGKAPGVVVGQFHGVLVFDHVKAHH
jgi:hypothetical protein